VSLHYLVKCQCLKSNNWKQDEFCNVSDSRAVLDISWGLFVYTMGRFGWYGPFWTLVWAIFVHSRLCPPPVKSKIIKTAHDKFYLVKQVWLNSIVTLDLQSAVHLPGSVLTHCKVKYSTGQPSHTASSIYGISQMWYWGLAGNQSIAESKGSLPPGICLIRQLWVDRKEPCFSTFIFEAFRLFTEPHVVTQRFVLFQMDRNIIS